MADWYKVTLRFDLGRGRYEVKTRHYTAPSHRTAYEMATAQTGGLVLSTELFSNRDKDKS